MEEKERYEIVYFDNDTRWKIIDNKTKQEVGGIDDMIKLLNQQYKQIADLEAKLAESKQEANDWKQRFKSSEERCKIFNANGVTALNLKNEKIEQLKQHEDKGE